MKSKKELFGIEIKEYYSANRKRKTEILDALVRQTKMHRISIMRAFRNLQLKSVYNNTDSRGRKVYYTNDCIEALIHIWESANYCCGELLHPLINERIDIAKKYGMWKWNEETTFKIRKVSIATLKRKIPKWRFFPVQRGISTTTPSSIKDRVPIFQGDWHTIAIGNGQVDTVAHCGGNVGGEYVFSCGYVDVSSGWTQYRAQINKGMLATHDSLSDIRDRLPFKLKMIHPDCGTEFLNNFVMDWCDRESIDVTRSRSYHKNDNGYIEQRNNHVVRKWMGYSRVEGIDLVSMMNIFYDLLAQYSNHFLSQRLCIGTKVASSGRIRKVYEKIAQTPFQRVLKSGIVDSATRNRLNMEHSNINPFVAQKMLTKMKYAILDLNTKVNKEVPFD